MATTLAGKVCLVTGATRGLGKGIALQLAEKGATVYITGRTLEPVEGTVVGSLRDTARDVEARGGNCIPVQCDHSIDDDVKRLFDQIEKEQDGQLDILVNNAYSGVHAITSNRGVDFWNQPISVWDDINHVGLRNHYLCAVFAAKMMVPRKRGLIVNVSSAGGLRYLFNVAYGIGKEACDRMAADCGFELRKHNVAFISLWPGAVGTEQVINNLSHAVKKMESLEKSDPRVSSCELKLTLAMFQNAETPEFSGQCIASLACDPDLMKKSGKICLTVDLGLEYGLQDKEGHTPMDPCNLKNLFLKAGRTWLGALTPSLLRMPKFLFSLGGNKFN